MECGAMLMEGGEWSTINGVSINEEADFMANLFSISSYNTYYTNDTNSNMNSLSQGRTYSGSSDSIAHQCHENYHLSDPDQFFAVNNGNSLPVEFCLDTKGVIQVFPGSLMEINHSLNSEMSCDNLEDPETQITQSENSEVITKHEVSAIEPFEEEEKSSDSSEVGMKRSRKSEVQKGKRNTRSKKSRKVGSDDEENNSSVKTRASRGSATDPQSLYARKRRERINERLRILQNLVPNGTKVDMSTMLEEAVSYVKFLQLQIKLLSSDDLWMYAPLAYNGMDIGLDAKLNSLL